MSHNEKDCEDLKIEQLPLEAIVKVFAWITPPNHFQPWQMKPQRETSGSGFIVSGRKLLTNAHVVAQATSIMVRRHGIPTKFEAKLEAIGHDCDVAMLTVEDDAFWHGAAALELGEVPKLQDSVTVVGYPTGGDSISLTSGVVSRIELQQYAHGDTQLPAIQIDAAINPGNSGGPAFKDHKVVGIAFQHLIGAEAINFVIPVSVVKHFLEDIARNGRYTGFGHLGAFCQMTENPSLCRFLKLGPAQTGVRITRMHPLSKALGQLLPDDVLWKIDGFEIAEDGTIEWRSRERIMFNFLCTHKFIGETHRLTVIRAGEVIDMDVELSTLHQLVPPHQFDSPPSFFTYAGLVFVPLIQPYLHEWGAEWFNDAPRKLCDRMFDMPSVDGEQVVILSHVLSDAINYGYQGLTNHQVKKFNGEKLINLKHLVSLVEKNTKPHLRFDLDDELTVVIDAAEATKRSPKILQQHRIPSPMSADLLPAEPIVATPAPSTKKNKAAMPRRKKSEEVKL